MTDDSHMPRRLEGEYENILGLNTLNTGAAAPPRAAELTATGANTVDRVSMEALINVLIKRGLCTENELLAEENRLHALRETVTRISFSPVQIPGDGYEFKRHDTNRLRRWAAKRHWSRKLGTLFFGWKWHRRKKEQQI
jgi:hypothetical protein